MPRWRLDDVMVSFATDQGGVGPHLDQYDVFLIQGDGKRRWRVGHKDQTVTKHRPHPDISQITAFTADMDIEVETGDLLYIPPNTPHWGESIGDSICYSVGFRAPNLDAIAQQLLEESDQQLDQLWQDESILSEQNRLGEISSEINDWTAKEVQKLTQSNKLKVAIGKEVTELKYPELLEQLTNCEAKELSEVAFFRDFQLNSISRLAYFKNNQQLMVFANGEYSSTHLENLELLEAINQYQTIRANDFSDITSKNSVRELLTWLFKVSAIELVE